MKNLNIILLFSIAFLISSCEKGEVITGSPVDTSLPVENIIGVISTDETDVVATQDFFIKVTLPKVFEVNTSVEAEILVPELNVRIKRSVIILAGQTSNDLKVTAPSSGVYNLAFSRYTVKVFLTGFGTASNVSPSGFAGKLYSISSNVLTLGYSDSDIIAANSTKLGINFDFEGPYTNTTVPFNDLDIVFYKAGVNVGNLYGNNTAVNNAYYGTRITTGRTEKININSSVALNGFYQIGIYAKKVAAPIGNVNYRFTVRFPNETVKTFTGTLNNVSSGGTAATALQVLQIEKTLETIAGIPTVKYIVTKLP